MDLFQYTFGKEVRSMHHLIHPTHKEVRIAALLYILAGILLFLLNNELLMIVIRILGVILMVVGGTLLYTYFGKRLSVDATPLFSGLPCILIGLLMAFSPESILSILPILTGIVIIINSIMQLQKTFLLRDYGFEGWNITAGIAVLALIVGVVLWLRPLQSVAFILQILGCALIFEGGMLFGFDHTIRKYKKRFEKEQNEFFE